MGVLVSDVVRMLHPVHAADGHCITIKHRGDPVTPDRIWWSCSCGISGTLPGDAIATALRLGVVTRT